MDNQPIKPTSGIDWHRIYMRFEGAASIIERRGLIPGAIRGGILALGVVALLRCSDII